MKIEKRRQNENKHLNLHLQSTVCLPVMCTQNLETLAPIGAEKYVIEFSIGEKEK